MTIIYLGIRHLFTSISRITLITRTTRQFSMINMAEQVNDNQKFTGIRLPKTVKPIHYDLTLKPNLDKFIFEGSVRIDYNVEQDPPSNELILNASELQITDGGVDAVDIGAEPSAKLKKVTYSEASETVTLEFDQNIPKVGKLSLQFNGTLNDKMKGFYRTAIEIDGITVHGATTQFEAVDARRCFPCWDEPAIRATFSVTLIYEKLLKFQGKTKSHEYPMVALSNMPVIEEKCEPETGKQVTKYDKTPKMSTYLLAFIVGPFESLDGTDGKRPVRIFTTLGKKEQAKFALDVTCKSLQFYENYFKIDYPLKKIDLIAIPDFSMGGMENWGLITFRESRLLVDGENTSTRIKELVALVITHEIAHQWFGNLVTIDWWTHLWLKEGFATFMEFLCVDHIFPEYHIWSQMVTDSYMTAMDLDALHSSHPIEVPVGHPSEVDEIFDNISYNKGASVIRMLYEYIGEEDFRTGLQEYLTKFSYKSAATEDLWASLEQASRKPVRKIMSDWTLRKGFPWLSVEFSREGALSLAQSKFTADGKLSAPEDANQLWSIPISAITSQNPSKTLLLGLLDSRSDKFVVKDYDRDGGWIKLNPSCVGLYHTAYPEEMMSKLLPAISNKTLQPLDRLGLQNEYFALCQAGKVSTVDLLKLIGAYRMEDNYTVWKSIDGCMRHLNVLLSNTSFQADFHAFGRHLYSEIFEKITWAPKGEEKHTDPLFRALVINRLVTFGDKRVIDEAKRKYKAHVNGLETIAADLRTAVYGAVACYGDDDEFSSLFNLLKKAELQEEKDRIASALGRTKDPQRLGRVLQYAFTDEVRNQDKIYFIVPIGVHNPLVAWRFFQDKKDIIRSKYRSGNLLSTVLKYSTQSLASEEMAQEVSKFFEANEFTGCRMTIQQSIETIRLNASWLARDKDTVAAFIGHNSHK